MSRDENVGEIIGTCAPPSMVHNSTVLPAAQPAYVESDVSAPSIVASTSSLVSETSGLD